MAALIAVCWLASLAIGNSDALDPASLTAGAFSVVDDTANAFSVPVAMLDKEQAEAFIKGKEQFNEAWVVAPEPNGVWGLGPTFNEDRCAHCHTANGRAKAAEDGHEAELGLLVRLSIPGQTKEGAPAPHPAYGDQLQNRGILDRVPAEGHVLVHYAPREVKLDVVLHQVKRHPLPPFRRTAGFSATTHVSRKDFAMTAWQSVVGDAVEIRLEVEGVRSRGGQVEDEAPAALFDRSGRLAGYSAATPTPIWHATPVPPRPQ